MQFLEIFGKTVGWRPLLEGWRPPTENPGSAPENSPEQAHPCGQILLETARK